MREDESLQIEKDPEEEKEGCQQGEVDVIGFGNQAVNLDMIKAQNERQENKQIKMSPKNQIAKTPYIDVLEAELFESFDNLDLMSF